MKILKHIEFGEIRTTIDENGNPLFRATDVAKALGYSDYKKAIRVHCKGVAILSTPSMSGNQSTSFIYEPDLYRLIIKSKLPSAQAFERWVFEDVLPSIRKYGMYATDELLENKKLLAQATKNLKNEREKNLHFIRSQQILTDTILDYTPKVEYFDNVLKSTDALTVTQIANDYGMTPYRLNKILADCKIQRKVSGQWILFKKYMNQGFIESETFHTRTSTKIHTKWTQKGRKFIYDILQEQNIFPICECTKPLI